MTKDQKIAFVEHLKELRNRLVVVVICFLSFALISLAKFDAILSIVKLPAKDRIASFAVFSPTEAIFAMIKLSFAVGLSLSIPVLVYQLWKFAAPALDDKLTRYGWLSVIVVSFLFASGCAFSYFFLLPASLDFLLTLGKDQFQFLISLDSYVSFVLAMLLGCGLVFQFPALSYVLGRFQIFRVSLLIEKWRVAAVCIMILSAIITPTPDAFNMMLLAIPMVFLYVISIACVAVAERHNQRAAVPLQSGHPSSHP